MKPHRRLIADSPPWWPGPLYWQPPSAMAPAGPRGQSSEYPPITEVVQSIVDELTAEHLPVARGEVTLTKAEAARRVLQAKVAACLAVLNGRTNVTEEDWRLTKLVMQVADATIEAMS